MRGCSSAACTWRHPSDRPPPALRGALTGLALGLNTLLVTSSLLPPALAKLLMPVAAVRRAADRSLNTLASTWMQRVFHGHIPFLKFFLKRDG